MTKRFLATLVLAVSIMGIISLNAFAAEITVANDEELAAAIGSAQDGDIIIMAEGTYNIFPEISTDNLTVKGNGNVVITTSTTVNLFADNFHIEGINLVNESTTAFKINGSGIIKNCNVKGANVFRWCYASDDVTFENCQFTGKTYGIHFDGIYGNDIIIKDCIVSGFNTFASDAESLQFINTEFIKNEYSDYNVINFRSNASVTNCTFSPDIQIGLGLSADEVITVTNTAVTDSSSVIDKFSVELSDIGTVIIDGIALNKVAKIGETYYTNLADAFQFAVSQPSDTTVEILSDIDFTDTIWSPVSVTGCGTVTINGNNKILSGLTDMLFSSTWAGNSGLIINDLTIANSNIVHDTEDATESVGVGAFCGFPQASETVTLNNCHLIDSSVNGGHWTGGLIGYAAGYSGNDGPVFETVTINNCSVKNSSVTGKGSVGGIIGHSTGDSWTKVIIENTIVENNTISSTGSSNVKAGAICGTIGCAGQPKETNGITKTGGLYISADVTGNTVTSNEALITTLYGRQGNSDGTLEITGGIYDNTPFNPNDTFADIISGAYSVTFDLNGGTGTSIKVMITDISGKLSYLPDAQKQKCSFSGWYDENDTKVSTETIFTDNSILIAKYSSNTSSRPITNKLPSTTGSAADNSNKTEQPADTSKTQIILTIGKTEASVFGQLTENDVAPKLVNDRTMLPARFVAESLGATVTWTETEPNKVLITKDDIEIIIYIGSDKAYVNGEEITLDSPAFLENDRTYTPIRFISEELGADVKWNDELQQVIITKKQF